MAKKAEKPVRNAPTTKPAAAAAPAAAKKSAQSKPASATPANSPRIDTSLAANTAAALIANKAAKSGDAGGGGAAPAKKESAAFKQLKAGLNKPSAGAMGGAFGIAGQSKKSHQPQRGPKQVGHNQTFGADVNRTGVPRRTPG